jgi:hypothetical protein
LLFKAHSQVGIQMPKTIQDALAIDHETGTDFWQKAIEKEIKNIEITFKVVESGQTIPIGY